MSQAQKEKPFRCEYGRHGASMDADTFACIIHGMEDKGISDVVVTRFSSAHGYGFHYAMDDSGLFIEFHPVAANMGRSRSGLLADHHSAPQAYGPHPQVHTL